MSEIASDPARATVDDEQDPATPHDPAAPADVDVVLPWYHSRLNLVVLAIAIAVLAGGLGYVIGNNGAIDDPNAVDIGFLQDMRYHHEQAIEMALLFLADPDTDPDLRTIAKEIVVGQQLEVGRMIQLLRDFGESEVNTTDVAMTWMSEPVDLDRMPGMATTDNLVALRAAEGLDADRIFVTLMDAHHRGGIHMAQYAVDHGAVKEVRDMAKSMVTHQTAEIAEMDGLLATAISG